MSGFFNAILTVVKGILVPLGLLGQLGTQWGVPGSPMPIDCAPEPIVIVGCSPDAVTVAWSCPKPRADADCLYDVEVTTGGVTRTFAQVAPGLPVEPVNSSSTVRLAKGNCRGPSVGVPVAITAVRTRPFDGLGNNDGRSVTVARSPRVHGPEER